MTLGENSANSAVGALESVEAVDASALKLAGAVTNAVPVGAPRDALSGTWLGHPLHPVLTDVVIGSFLSATLLDLLGGDDTGRASERLIEIGLVTSAPTVATGLSDWAMTVYGDRRTRPVGLAHASANLSASTLYAASLAARRRGARAGASSSASRAARCSRSVPSSAVTSRSRAESVSMRRRSTRGPATGRRSRRASSRMAGRPARWRATRPFCCSDTTVTCTRCTIAARIAAACSAAVRSRASPSSAHATARASTFVTARSSVARRRRRNPYSRPATARARSR